jgi:hypothetical protein
MPEVREGAFERLMKALFVEAEVGECFGVFAEDASGSQTGVSFRVIDIDCHRQVRTGRG